MASTGYQPTDCTYIEILEREIPLEHWYPPNCNESPEIEYCAETDALVLVYGFACGKKFLAMYIPSERHGKPSVKPGEFDKIFYELVSSNKIPGLNVTFLDPLDSVINVDIEPPGRSSLYFSVLSSTGKAYHVKAYRILEDDNMEPLVLAYLRDNNIDFSPRLTGFIEFSGYFTHIFMERIEGEPIVSHFVREALRTLEKHNISTPKLSEKIGRLMGKLHCIMSKCDYEWCRPQPVTQDDLSRWIFRINWRLEHMKKHPDPHVREIAMRLSDHSDALNVLARYNLPSIKMRTHGDPHLYQFVTKSDGELMLVDYEGEPDRLPATQSEKEPPIRDLAVIYRSLHYIAVISYSIQKGLEIKKALASLPDIMYSWINETNRIIQEQYETETKDCLQYYNHSDQALTFWSIERATYEFFYESIYNTGLESIPLSWLEKSLDIIDKKEY
ncbi:MAG: hypothetical protein GSR79_04935 [Desulfurococcales archaeon]|nr:hypothetical protein [Desulfurococcales archaeon]